MRGFLGPAIALAMTGLAMLPSVAAACGPNNLERAIVDRVTAEGELVLQDQRRIRLAGVQIIHMKLQDWPKSGESIGLGLLSNEDDRWSRLPAVVFALSEEAPPVWLQQRLMERGAALARPEHDIGECWQSLANAEAENRQGLAQLLPEAGRFARIAGRVQRVGEGRSAHFITLYEPSGARVSGMVQKRHLKRFKDAGVDVAKLQGHVIRMRGVRSAANPAVIALTLAEQIEIVR